MIPKRQRLPHEREGRRRLSEGRKKAQRLRYGPQENQNRKRILYYQWRRRWMAFALHHSRTVLFPPSAEAPPQPRSSPGSRADPFGRPVTRASDPLRGFAVRRCRSFDSLVWPVGAPQQLCGGCRGGRAGYGAIQRPRLPGEDHLSDRFPRGPVGGWAAPLSRGRCASFCPPAPHHRSATILLCGNATSRAPGVGWGLADDSRVGGTGCSGRRNHMSAPGGMPHGSQAV